MIQLFLQKILEKLNENAEVIFVTSAFFMLFWIFGVKGRYKRAMAMLCMAMIAAFFYGGMLAWVQGLGGDSFWESRDVKWAEAIQWFSSFAASMPGMVPPQKTVLFILSVSLCVSYLLARWCRLQKYAVHVVTVLMVLGHLNLAWGTYQGFVASRHYIAGLKSEFQEPVTGMGPAADVELVLYIGESTSSLNMSTAIHCQPCPCWMCWRVRPKDFEV